MKLKFNDRVDIGLLVLRAGIGLMFAFVHGLPKVIGGLETWRSVGGAFTGLIGISFVPAFWGFAAAISEFGGGLLLVAGIFFRSACAVMLFTMAVAIASIVRGGYGFNGAAQPIELGAVLLALFFTGPGKLTLPRILSRTKN